VLAERYERHLQDLTVAVEMYAKTKNVEFHIPDQLNTEQRDILKGMVTEKIALARQECVTLDIRIDQLQHGVRSDRDGRGKDMFVKP
jgi:hypothetical protein